jgi:hypothetical protein
MKVNFGIVFPGRARVRFQGFLHLETGFSKTLREPQQAGARIITEAADRVNGKGCGGGGP